MTSEKPHHKGEKKAEHTHTEKHHEKNAEHSEKHTHVHEKKVEHTEKKEAHEHKHDEKKHEHAHGEKHEHTHDDKKPKKEESKKVKKENAKVFGRGMPISLKHAMYICSFIKFKDIDTAIKELGEVMRMKRIIPFKGEIPHRKGPGMMSGRYPVKAAEHFIPILKGLKGNALVNGLALERTRISSASANWGARPMRRGGREKGKRTHVTLICREMEAKK